MYFRFKWEHWFNRACRIATNLGTVKAEVEVFLPDLTVKVLMYKVFEIGDNVLARELLRWARVVIEKHACT